MPDITMCKGEGCNSRQTCYRFNAKSNYFQSYFQGSPIKNNVCDYYWNKNNTIKM